MQQKSKCVILFIVLIAIMGCQRKYWFRIKIDVPHSNKYSVKIKIVNDSDSLLSKNFENILHKAAAKELKKKGFYEIPIDSPQFLFTLQMKVDSFNASRLQDYSKKYAAMYSNKPQSAPYAFSHTVKAIMFNCELRHYKQNWVKWTVADDVYYFGEYRDIGRSEGMVRYLIRSARPR